MSTATDRACLLTGATGYLGIHLARRLLAEGWRVHAVVRAGSPRERLPLEHPGLELIEYDGSVAPLEATFERAPVEAVFHLSALSVYQVEPARVHELVAANLTVGLQILELMRERGGRFVAAGSYWQTQGPRDPLPNSLYAATKQAFEDLLAYYHARTPIRAATLRLMDVYGPEDWRGRLLDQIYDAHQQGRAVALSPGEQLVDMIYVDDVVEAFLCAERGLREGKPAAPPVRFVSSGGARPLKQVVALYQDVLGSNVEVEWGGRAYRPTEIMQPVVGTPVEGWQPRVSLRDGLARVVAAQRAVR